MDDPPHPDYYEFPTPRASSSLDPRAYQDGRTYYVPSAEYPQHHMAGGISGANNHHHHHSHAVPETPFPILNFMFQHMRPSPHSYIIMLSHMAFLLCITAAVRRGLVLESLALALSCSISLLYHLCDENIYCAAGVDIYGWHAADVWSTFFLICFVMGVMMLDIRSRLVKNLLRLCYFVAVTLFVWIDAGNMLLLGSLLIAVASSVVLRYSFFPPEPRDEECMGVSLAVEDEGAGGAAATVDSALDDVATAVLNAVAGGNNSSSSSSPTLQGFGGATPTRALVNRNRRSIVTTTLVSDDQQSHCGIVDGGAGGGRLDMNDNGGEDVATAPALLPRRAPLNRKGGDPHANRQSQKQRFLAIALGIFTFALACFVVANTPVVGPETYVREVHGEKKPMDVPDTAVYWVFHSVWHFSSAIAGYYMVRFLTH